MFLKEKFYKIINYIKSVLSNFPYNKDSQKTFLFSYLGVLFIYIGYSSISSYGIYRGIYLTNLAFMILVISWGLAILLIKIDIFFNNYLPREYKRIKVFFVFSCFLYQI